MRTLTLACSIVSIADPATRKIVPWLHESWWSELPHDLREPNASYPAVNSVGREHWNELHHRSREGSEPVSQPPGNENATLATFGQIGVPTLLISGDEDLLAPPPVARLLDRAMPDTGLVILTECGHSAYWERPGEFNTAVLDFIGRRAT